MIKRIFQMGVKGLIARLQSKRFRVYSVGFHGDLHLMALVDILLSRSRYFIETGTNVGSTLKYVARKYPHIKCYSCEPDKRAYEFACRNTKEYRNVNLYNQASGEFIKEILTNNTEVDRGPTLFWLDAHGYGFDWPLRQEIDLITRNWKQALILIDDFYVPGLECFGYDKYEEQICSFDWIKESINPKLQYHLYYPQYTDRTSKHHPLRGWGLIEYGSSDSLMLPDSIKSIVNQEF